VRRLPVRGLQGNDIDDGIADTVQLLLLDA
jgi:hypothetical protein